MGSVRVCGANILLINDGRGVFADEAADFNGDGIADLYLASRGPPDVLLFGRPPM
ncbi:MAG: hypothetical protein JSW65_07130 [Candidatus Bipolaricaulota bacterium]|nr:MAG: hypothetical protein JSW65_07130 [Candidatus Bipolaricaulota bacterium]